MKKMFFLFSIVFLIFIVSACEKTSETKKENPSSTFEILIVNGKLKQNVLLDKQLDKIKKEKISKLEYEELKGKVVSNFEELKGKTLIVDLQVGSPIFKSAVVDLKQLKKKTEDDMIFPIEDGTKLLPKEIKKGDKVNVALTIKKEDKVETGFLLKGVAIYDIDNDFVYLKLTNEQYLKLSTAVKLGTLSLEVSK